jgi:predicted Ser/Thr protein kinase
MKYCPLCEKNYGDEAQVCELDGAALRPSGQRQGALIGEVIKGRYRVLEKLGQGGMGTVYLAEQVAISRKVALKLLHADYAQDQEFVRRFRQEARLAASLNHRNVVTIFDFDQADDGSLYIVMEYVDGKSLAGVVQEGLMEVGRALRLAVQIADGLAAAHRAGVIHRDVKPENIMVVGQREEIKLMDFGIARLRDTGGASRLTRSGTIMGTPAYMAPEQIEGGEVSERTDIYAFGIVLYELLSGVVPFTAPTPGAILIKHLQETAVPLRKARREIPVSVERIVAQALAKSPESRQNSMQEVAEALKETERRAEVQKKPATRIVIGQFAKLWQSLGAIFALLMSLLGKAYAVAARTTSKRAARAAETQPPAATEVIEQTQALVQEEQEPATPETGLTPLAPAEDKSHPAVRLGVGALLTKFKVGFFSRKEQAVENPVETKAAAEQEETTVALRTVVPPASETLVESTVLSPLPMEQRVEQVLKAKPPSEREEMIATLPTEFTSTVAPPVGSTMAESAVVLPPLKAEKPGGVRWKWVGIGFTAVALLGVIGIRIYDQLLDQKTEAVAVMEAKHNQGFLGERSAPPSPSPVVKVEPEAGTPENAKSDIAASKAESKVIEKPQTYVAPRIPTSTEAKTKNKGTEAPKTVEPKAPIGDFQPQVTMQPAKTKNPPQEATSNIAIKNPTKVVEPEKAFKAEPASKEGQTEIASLGNTSTKPPEIPVKTPPSSEVKLLSLAVVSDKKELNVNGRLLLTVKGKYSDGRENEILGGVRWESSDASVAVVNSRGEIEARKEGKAQITAKYSGLASPTYTFYVKAEPQPQKTENPQEGIQDIRRRLLR